MSIVRLRGLAFGAAFGIAATVGAHDVGAADADWLTALSGPLAEAGYSLNWKSMSLDPAKGRVQARGLTSADAAGRVVLRIAGVAVDRPRPAPGGSWTADVLVLDKVEVPGATPTRIQRVVVTRPDLGSVARLMATVMDARTGAADPAERPIEVERLELQGLDQEWTADGGERIAATVATVQVSSLQLDPAAFAVAGDPSRLRPLSALAAVRVGLFEAEGVRVRSSQSGITEIDRKWIKNTARVPGRSGVLQYGNAGVRMRPGGPGDPMAPLLATLFPPHGDVPSQSSGEIAYDVAEGFLGLRQRTEIDRFGTLDVNADLRGVPDLTVDAWRSVRDDDPRLDATLVHGLSVALTDAGGVDRALATMADDGSVTPAQLRAAFATQFDVIGQGFNPNRDPLFAAWLGAVRDFVRIGGTLALAAARPIPVTALADQELELEAGALTGLARRYGLSLERR